MTKNDKLSISMTKNLHKSPLYLGLLYDESAEYEGSMASTARCWKEGVSRPPSNGGGGGTYVDDPE